MGFLSTAPKVLDKLPSIRLMHKLECKICPLNKIPNFHPHMAPSGADRPIVYILGEAPGAAEDKDGEQQFIGDSGQLLRARIPKAWFKKIRFNNVVRTRPPKNRTPEPIEIECCRPSVERDIAASKPKAIFGFGNVPLEWVTGGSGIFDWRGRRFPVNIAGHECWFYPFLHPAFLLRQRNKYARRPSDIGSEDERAFVFDLKRAFAEIESSDDAVVHDEQVAMYGVETIDGTRANDIVRLEKLLTWAKKQLIVGVDYETNRTRPYDEEAKILTAAIGTDEVSFSFAIRHPGAGWTKKQLAKVEALWVDFLEADVLKVVHFLNFEMEWTAFFYGWDLLRASPWGATETQASTLDARTGRKRKAGPLSLEFLVRQYFGFNLKHLSNLDRSKLEFAKVGEVLTYNAMDAKYHYWLYMMQQERLDKEGLTKTYEQSLRRVPTCALSQLKGVPISKKEVRKLDKEFSQQIEEATADIENMSVVAKFESIYKQPFNPGSNPDVAKLLRSVLKRREGLKEDGKYSTDEEVLERIDHPICEAILRFRKASKKKSTYLYTETWPDGLLHPVFNTVFTETGRLSAEDPNVQNIPIRDPSAAKIRKQIVAPPGYSILAADYGQIEARCFAMTAKDKAFIKALWDRFDIHGYWAERIAKAYPDRIGGKEYLKDKDVLKTFRGDIKNQWTFPLFFGAQLSGVAEFLRIPETKLEPEFREFKRMFPRIFDWQEEVIEFYRENGYVETLNGRRRHAPLSRNQALNAPIQGLAAEIVMDGMSRLSEYASKVDDYNYQPNLNIHDDLTFFVPTDQIETYAEKIITEMVRVPFKFVNVPITIEVSIGQNLMKHNRKTGENPDGMEGVLDASSDDWKVTE